MSSDTVGRLLGCHSNKFIYYNTQRRQSIDKHRERERESLQIQTQSEREKCLVKLLCFCSTMRISALILRIPFPVMLHIAK